MILTQTVEWVPVGERLPDRSAIFQTADKFGKVILLGFSEKRQKWFGIVSNLDFSAAVTHWALPLRHPNDLHSY